MALQIKVTPSLTGGPGVRLSPRIPTLSPSLPHSVVLSNVWAVSSFQSIWEPLTIFFKLYVWLLSSLTSPLLSMSVLAQAISHCSDFFSPRSPSSLSSFLLWTCCERRQRQHIVDRDSYPRSFPLPHPREVHSVCTQGRSWWVFALSGGVFFWFMI